MSISLIALHALYEKDPVDFRARFRAPMLLWHDPAPPLKGEFVPQTTQGFAHSAPRVRNPIAWEVKKQEGAKDGMSVITLGRSVGADINIDHTAVSRMHAFFWLDPKSGSWRVSDASSKNGTWVQEQRVAPASWVDLSDRCIVKFGKAQVQFLMPETFIAELPKLAGDRSP